LHRIINNAFLEEFKSNNKLLVKIAIVAFVLIQPVLLLFGALPGYLILTSPILSAPYLASALFLVIVTLLCLQIFSLIYPTNQLRWLYCLLGKAKFYRQFIAKLAACLAPAIAFLFAGFLKIESETANLLATLPILIVLSALLTIKSRKALQESQSRFASAKLIRPYIKVNLTQSIAVIINLIIFTLCCAFAQRTQVILSFFSVGFVFHAALIWVIHKQNKVTFNTYVFFYRSISKPLANKVNARISIFLLGALALPFLLLAARFYFH